MDDASGVASLLDMAETLHDAHIHPRRSLLFIAVTAEEKGLLGSAFFAHNPTVDKKHIVADLNVDMFLPLFPLRLMTVYGLNESDLGPQIREVGKRLGVRIQDDQEPQRNIFIRSDQYSFIREGVPSLAFKVGYQKGYARGADRQDMAEGALPRAVGRHKSAGGQSLRGEIQRSGAGDGESGSQSHRASALEHRQLLPPLRDRLLANLVTRCGARTFACCVDIRVDA